MSVAADPGGVLEALAAELGAASAGVYVPTADGGALERVCAAGPTLVRVYDRFPPTARLPVADTFTDGRARWFETAGDWAAYPASLHVHVEAQGLPSVAVLPLERGGARIGVLYAGFAGGTALAPLEPALRDAAARLAAALPAREHGPVS